MPLPLCPGKESSTSLSVHCPCAAWPSSPSFCMKSWLLSHLEPDPCTIAHCTSLKLGTGWNTPARAWCSTNVPCLNESLPWSLTRSSAVDARSLRSFRSCNPRPVDRRPSTSVGGFGVRGSRTLRSRLLSVVWAVGGGRWAVREEGWEAGTEPRWPGRWHERGQARGQEWEWECAWWWEQECGGVGGGSGGRDGGGD